MNIRLLLPPNNFTHNQFCPILMVPFRVASRIEKNIRETMLGVEREGPLEIKKGSALKIESESG